MFKKLIRSIVDFYLYSSIHISLGAGLSVLFVYAALTHIPTSDYIFFVISSTLFLYCCHRIVGIQKVKAFEKEGRFAVIKKYKSHLFIYTLLGGAGATYFFMGLEREIQLMLFLPGLVSILYVLPLFSKGKRLRDFNFIKIFLIAIIWGLIIGLIPYFEVVKKIDFSAFLIFSQSTLFIFAITLPFDVRDLEVDNDLNVSTIPSKIGKAKTYLLAYGCLLTCGALAGLLTYFEVYTLDITIALILAYLITAILICLSKNKTDDYYYSGLLDGSISIVALAGILASGMLALLF